MNIPYNLVDIISFDINQNQIKTKQQGQKVLGLMRMTHLMLDKICLREIGVVCR